MFGKLARTRLLAAVYHDARTIAMAFKIHVGFREGRDATRATKNL